jgi:hypothetical protein
VAALPLSGAAALPRVAACLCDRKRLDEVRRFFDGHVARFPLAQLAAEETLERIEVCVALREAQGAGAVVYIARG